MGITMGSEVGIDVAAAVAALAGADVLPEVPSLAQARQIRPQVQALLDAPVGTELVTALTALMAVPLSEREAREVVVAWDKLTRHAAAAQLTVMASWQNERLSRVEAEVAAGDKEKWATRSGPSSIAAELAPSLGVGTDTVTRRVRLASFAEAHTPAALDSVTDAVITEAHLAALFSICRDVPACLYRRLEEEAITLARRGHTATQLVAALRTLAAELDPDHLAAARERGVADRGVWTSRSTTPGCSRLSALLPAEHAQAVMIALHLVVAAAKATGDRRTTGQLMADALTGCLTGMLAETWNQAWQQAADTGLPVPTPEDLATLAQTLVVTTDDTAGEPGETGDGDVNDEPHSGDGAADRNGDPRGRSQGDGEPSSPPADDCDEDAWGEKEEPDSDDDPDDDQPNEGEPGENPDGPGPGSGPGGGRGGEPSSGAGTGHGSGEAHGGGRGGINHGPTTDDSVDDADAHDEDRHNDGRPGDRNNPDGDRGGQPPPGRQLAASSEPAPTPALPRAPAPVPAPRPVPVPVRAPAPARAPRPARAPGRRSLARLRSGLADRLAAARAALAGWSPPCMVAIPTGLSRAVRAPLVIRYSTLTGADARPAHLPGYGPLPADAARAVAARSRYRWLHADRQTGHLLHRDARCHPPPVGGWDGPGAPAPPGLPQEITATMLREGYVPGSLLRGHVEVRDATCIGPVCHHPARSTPMDIDHTINWGQTNTDGVRGQTQAGNLGLGCRRTHLLKTHGGWGLVQTGPGTFEWTSPLGVTFTRDAAPLLPGWNLP